MKRFLSLFLVAVMLFAVLAMVGCGKTEETTTAEIIPAETTTQQPEETTTKAPEVTTPEETTPAETTTEKPEETTTAAPETTTAAPETTTKKPEETTTVAGPTESTTGETVPMFLRFDFGTKSKAQDLGETKHEYIVEKMKVGSALYAMFTEDTLELYATTDYNSSKHNTSTDYSSTDAIPPVGIAFDDLVTYDFPSDLVPGWGSWAYAPYSNANYSSWVGRLQYMKIRMHNPTDNNLISLAWFTSGKDGSGYSTAQYAPAMYLQGGAPTDKKDLKKTATPQKDGEWFVRVYDVTMLSAFSRGNSWTDSNARNTYVDAVNYIKANGASGSTNWLWSATSGAKMVTGLRFYLLGAYSPSPTTYDTRANIHQGDHVSVDYIIFGADYNELMAWHSYLEDAAV